LGSNYLIKYPGTIAKNTIIGIASASDEQAKKLLSEMKKLMRLGDTFMKSKYRNDEDKPIFGEHFFYRLTR